jgi:hypothetical protein
MLTPESLGALADHLVRRFKAFVRGKGNAVEMQAIAQAFGVAVLLGAGVPTGDAFLTRWWTTLGPVVYAPSDRVADLGASVPVLSHELQHVVQFWRDPLRFVARYLTSRGRAELEAEAERARLEVCWLLWGYLPPVDGLDVTRHGYALDDSHADLTRDLLEQAATSVASGLISTDVGLEVLLWMRAHHKGAILGRVS